MESLPDGIVLPKVAKKKDVMKIDSIVGDVERQKQIEEGSISFVLIGTEVPEAVFNLHKMAKIPPGRCNYLGCRGSIRSTRGKSQTRFRRKLSGGILICTFCLSACSGCGRREPN